MGIAMAISAAATTKISKTSTAPAVESRRCAKVTRLRFTAFSMSSMHISMTSAMRRTTTPVRPVTNSATASASRMRSSSTTAPSHMNDCERRDDGSDQQDRDQLEMQPVLVQESHREHAHAEARERDGAGELGH